MTARGVISIMAIVAFVAGTLVGWSISNNGAAKGQARSLAAVNAAVVDVQGNTFS